jgi:hypothetical protein
VTAAAKSFVILLREHLEAEIAAHRQLLALAEERGRALAAGDRDLIARLNDAEEQPAAEAARLRACRERLVIGLAERLNTPARDVRLAKLIDLLPEPNRRELGDRRTELNALLVALRDKTDRNQTLIRSSLSIVEHFMRAIAGCESAGAYDRRGGPGAAATARGGLVDARI